MVAVAWSEGRPPARPVASRPVAEPVDARWFDLFNDPLLSAMESQVAASNLDVRVASIRLAESRISVGVSRAGLFPQLNANASYTREKPSDSGVLSLFPGSASSPATGSNGLGGTQGGIPNNSALTNPFDLYQAGFDATWELDLWGRVRRSVEAAGAQAEASEETRRDTLLTALAELARDYLQLRGTQQTLAITRQNLDTANQILGLTREQERVGLGTDLDVANASAQVGTVESQIAPLEQQEAALINAVALLLGEPPNATRDELTQHRPQPPVPPAVPVGLPSELARRRPDIRQAEANLHAATANIGVAVADFYPTFTLSGSVALQTIQFHELGNFGNAETYALGPSITLPIFQGGKLTRTLELRQTEQQEAAVNYQRAVLGALHDVDNALTAYESEQRRLTALERSAADNARALRLARDRYQQGLSDFLQVLDAQRSLLSAQQQLASSTETIATNLVQLYKALGGGWETDFPDHPEPPGPTAGEALKQAAQP